MRTRATIASPVSDHGLLAGVSVAALLGGARSLGFRPNPAVAGILAGAGEMAATDGPMAALGVSDPTS